MDNTKGTFETENFLILTLILSENQCHKCICLVKEMEIRGGIVIIGRGTVSSSILNLLGIKSQRKEVIKLLLERERAKEILSCLEELLELSKPGHGIAYTKPVIYALGLPEQEKEHKQIVINPSQHMEGESMFKKLTVIVDYGMANDVMDIALNAGVRGGTILHGRGTGAEIATNLFGVEIEPEKELVIILTPDNLVDKVVNDLNEGLKLYEPGKGILFVEPIVDTRGLFETRDKNNK
jgi:nitrogen regulatory protein PII